MEDETIKISEETKVMLYELQDKLTHGNISEVLSECVALMYDVKIDKDYALIEKSKLLTMKYLIDKVTKDF